MFTKQTLYPLRHFNNKEMVLLKNFILNPNIQVGDYTYYHDKDDPEKFEKENVVIIHTCKLIIGKFCQIAQGTKFIMSDANHPMSGFSTYPFYVLGEEWSKYQPDIKKKGDTVIGNDVWFGHQAIIMPGIKIGDGAIIAALLHSHQGYSPLRGCRRKSCQNHTPPVSTRYHREAAGNPMVELGYREDHAQYPSHRRLRHRRPLIHRVKTMIGHVHEGERSSISYRILS